MRSGSRHWGEAGGGWLFGFPPLLATGGRNHKGDCDMRNGAIFARGRGSCRALMWMALVAVVSILGVGEVFAQVNINVAADGTVSVPSTRNTGRIELSESSARVPVTVTATIAANAPASDGTTVTLTLARPTAGQLAPGLPNGVPPDMLGEVDPTTADVRWAGVARGTLETTVVLDWGNESYVQTRTETVILETHQDDDAEHEFYNLTVTSTGTHLGIARVRMADNDPQTYVLRYPSSRIDAPAVINEGQSIPVRFEAVPKKTVAFPIRVNLQSAEDSSQYHLTTTDGAAISQEVDVPAPETGSSQYVDIQLNSFNNNDGDRRDDTVTLAAYLRPGSGDEGNWYVSRSAAGDPLEVLVRDIHKLPDVTLGAITPIVDNNRRPALPSREVEEGQTVMVQLRVDRGPFGGDHVPNDEKIKVTVSRADGSSADAGDFKISRSPVVVAGTTAREVSIGEFELDVFADEDIGAEELVLMAVVEGDDPSKGYDVNGDQDTVELGGIAFVDKTLTKINAKSPEDIYEAVMDARADGADANGLWTPNETLVLMAEELFHWPETTTNVVLATIEFSDPQVASASTANDKLTIKAESAGTTTVSVTATVVGELSGVVTTSQTTSNAATVTFPVTVDAHAITAMSDADVQTAADAAVADAASRSANKRWEPAPEGVAAMVALSDLFDVPESIEVRYLAESSDNSDVMAVVSGTNVELTPKSPGQATITVTAVDVDRPGSAVVVDFDVTVVEKSAIRGRTQSEVDAVFEGAGADGLVAQGPSITVDMSKLFDFGDITDRTLSYAADSSDMDVLVTSVTGMMLTLTPGTDPAGGMSTIMVRGDSTYNTGGGNYATVEYMAMVDKLPPMLTITSDPMDMVEEGGGITVTATLNQTAPHDKAIAVQVTGPATPKEAEIMLMTGMESASVMLMANDDYDPMSDWNDIVIVVSHEAVMGGSAVLTLSVTENDSEIAYTLSGPDDMNLVEGEEYELTVMAEPVVPMDTEVMVMRDRANSDADENDYAVESIMIMAGESSGSDMLMIEDDGAGDAGHGDPEELTLYGMVGNMQTNSVSFYLWDAAVPALPLIAQLLLAAFLAIGGYRRYLRR